MSNKDRAGIARVIFPLFKSANERNLKRIKSLWPPTLILVLSTTNKHRNRLEKVSNENSLANLHIFWNIKFAVIFLSKVTGEGFVVEFEDK